MTGLNSEKVFRQGLTYDDVLIVPAHSQVLPQETNLRSRFSRNIVLNVPLVSAAMDTVTEAKAAIVMAREGGIGVIHKNMPLENHAAEVKAVKKSESGMITDPICVEPTQTVGDVLALMGHHNISGLPVLDQNRLVGIVTGRDISFEHNLTKTVKDVMTKEVVTAIEGTSLEEAVEILHTHRIEKLPVLARGSQSIVGMFTIKDIEKARRHPFASKDSKGRLMVAAAVGARGDYLERAEALLFEGVDALVVDTAHGHSQLVLDAVKKIKQSFKNHPFDVLGGNVATAAACRALVEAGADGVKVGIGPGSICTTRIVAGIGVPQFTAVMDCAQAGKELGVPITADGGIKYSGDVVKALAGGASSVMIGSLFAGTDETPGEMVIYQGKSYKTYRGMGSIGAMVGGSKDRYFQSDVSEQGKLVPEGIEGRVPYKGPLSQSIFQMVGGIRAAMGYIGAEHVESLQEKAEFMRISPAGLRESHAHDVFITREAPNYKMD
ncbi:MAG: IMP dehydrogenase [Oligoflexales bacterium]|nr:IMP dehydrogenase [Oligoflexales bacterium]